MVIGWKATCRKCGKEFSGGCVLPAVCSNCGAMYMTPPTGGSICTGF